MLACVWILCASSCYGQQSNAIYESHHNFTRDASLVVRFEENERDVATTTNEARMWPADTWRRRRIVGIDGRPGALPSPIPKRPPT